MDKRLTVKLDVSVTGNESDGELQALADRHLPDIIEDFGRQTAEYMWGELKRSLGEFTDTSWAAQRKFISETTAEFVREFSQSDRLTLRENVMEQLTKQRDDAKS